MVRLRYRPQIVEKMEPKDKIYRPRTKMMLDNFLGGISWSIGAFVGTTLLVGLIGLFFSKINLVPIIGSWVAQIIEVSRQYGVK